MKIIFPALLLFCIPYGYGQDAYSIVYNSNPYKEKTALPVTFNGQQKFIYRADKSRLVFNDSIAFFYHFTGEKDPLKNDVLFTRKAMHHSTYYLLHENLWYDVKAWPKASAPELKKIIIPALAWKILQTEVLVLGYKCNEAYAVKATRDTVFARFTHELPFPYGPYAFTGLPGVVLEYFDQQYNRFFTAEEIVKGNYTIRLPRKYKAEK